MIRMLVGQSAFALPPSQRQYGRGEHGAQQDGRLGLQVGLQVGLLRNRLARNEQSARSE